MGNAINKIKMKHSSERTEDIERLFNRINVKIKEATRILKQLGYESENISAREFYDYMTGETPTGDTVTLYDVLRNEFFMIHEVVEISELKRMGISINKQTIMRYYPKVYEAHITAMDYELTHALNKKDYEWFKRRFVSPEIFLSQLNDPYLPPEYNYLPQQLTPKCKSIIKKFSKHFRQIG